MNLDRPLLMGILNVTPDSFSDGGQFLDPSVASDAGFRMLEEGADIIDVGGESTRPGAPVVPAEEELARIEVPVTTLTSRRARVSIDTSKALVARKVLPHGVWMINDVTAFGDPEMAKICAEARCQVCLMHMQGTPQTMQLNPTYNDVVTDVRDFLLERAAYAESQGVARGDIWIDPGFGFGKTFEHNLELLSNLGAFVETGYKVLIGISRKSFLGRLGNPSGPPLPVEERLPVTQAAHMIALDAGVSCIRAHDIREARSLIDLRMSLLKP